MKPDRDYFASNEQHETLLHAFLALKNTDDIGVTCVTNKGEVSTSWSTLVQRAQRRAHWLQRQGLAADQTIGLALPNDTLFIECFFACWMLGCIPVPLARPGLLGPQSLERTRHIAADAGLQQLLCPQEDHKQYEPIVDIVQCIPVQPLTEADSPKAPIVDISITPERIGLIQYTSGSTSRPKGVVLTHQNLITNCNKMSEEYPFGQQESFSSWLPFYHDMGLIAELLTVVSLGLPFYLMEPLTFLQDPFIWLESLSRHRCTLAVAPNFALAHCVRRITETQLTQLDLRALRALYLGAEPISEVSVKDFTERFQRTGLTPKVIGSAYGLAECTVGVSRSQSSQGLYFDTVDREQLAQGKAVYVESDDEIDTKKIASVGKIYSEHYGIIVDDEGHEVEERTVGELWVRGPSVMKGYWNNDKATKEVLVTRNGQQWLKTGDLAYFAKGELYICGRNKDLLIIRGKNYHPEDIERAAEQIESIRSGQTVAFSIPGDATEEIVIVCETAAPVSEHSSLALKVKGHINTQVGLKVKHVELQPPRTIPKTTSGKRQRRLVRTIWMKMRGHV